MYRKLCREETEKIHTSGVIGSKVVYFDSLTSTFDKIRTLDFQNGLTVVCSRQSDGTGRMGRNWESADGGIYFTFAMEHTRRDFDVPFITSVCALAVCNVLSEYVPCKIKWPNDIVSDGKKLCGILTKNYVSDGKINQIHVGIGINANNTFSDNLPYASSLFKICGKKVDENAILKKVLEEADRIYLAQSHAQILEDYKKLCINLGREVTLCFGGKETKGICKDILPDGSMEVETDGKIICVNSGEVSVKGIYS